MSMIRRIGVALAVAAAGVLAGGCAGYRPLGIEPVKAEAVDRVQPKFQQAFYRVDRDNTLHFVMQGTVPDPVTGQPVEQMLLVRMFWQPKGGRTSLQPTALNATYRYILMTPTAVGMYEGAGFVRISDKPGSGKLDARIVDGDLRLTEASADFQDTLGRSRIRGNFAARLSPAETVDRSLDVAQRFFERSWELTQKKEDAGKSGE